MTQYVAVVGEFNGKPSQTIFSFAFEGKAPTAIRVDGEWYEAQEEELHENGNATYWYGKEEA